MATVNKLLVGAVLALVVALGVLGALYNRQVRSNAELSVTVQALQASAKARAKADEKFNAAQAKEAKRQKEETRNVENALQQDRAWADAPVPAGVCAALGLCDPSSDSADRTAGGDT